MEEERVTENQRKPKAQLMFGRYEVLKTIGSGGVGSVYKVRDLERDGLEMALKVLTSEIPFDEHTLDRFRDELELSKEIRHPNLIEAYDLIEQENKLAYSMEYIDGEDLFTIFRRTKLDSNAIDSVMRQLLLALQALHEHGIYHRDIKLENIMVRRDGVVKLADLGLVKSMDSKAYTKTGILLGTAAYMPPEYIKMGEYDHRSDIYAAGIVLYELLAGRRRLENRNGNEIINHLIKTNFTLSKVSLGGVHRKYLKILDRATAIEPAKRFSSADKMREAFSDEGLEFNDAEVSPSQSKASEATVGQAAQAVENPELRQRYSIQDATSSRRVAKHHWFLGAAMVGASVLVLGALALYLS